MGQNTRKVFCASLLALLVSTQTITGQLRKEDFVYSLTFSGEVTSTTDVFLKEVLLLFLFSAP